MNSVRQQAHIEFKDKVCPNCQAKGSIIFWKDDGAQADLSGNKTKVAIRCLPKCSRCGKKFPRGQNFGVIR